MAQRGLCPTERQLKPLMGTTIVLPPSVASPVAWGGEGFFTPMSSLSDQSAATPGWLSLAQQGCLVS